MKKLLTLCLLLFVSFGTAKAQTAKETLEWLKVKKDNIRNEFSETVGDKFKNGIKIEYKTSTEFTEEYVKIYDDGGAYTRINWSDIKDVRVGANFITIISESISKITGGRFEITFNMVSRNFALQYAKGIKHMAKLKGAELIKDDLFGQ